MVKYHIKNKPSKKEVRAYLDFLKNIQKDAEGKEVKHNVENKSDNKEYK